MAQFTKQPRVLHRDDGLRREVLQKSDLFVGEWIYFCSKSGDCPKQNVIFSQRDYDQRTRPGKLDQPMILLGLRSTIVHGGIPEVDEFALS